MQINENIFYIIGGFLILSNFFLIMMLVMKMEKNKELESSIEKLKQSLDEMDEQAKLIVRTDMELNKTQEELDKKVSGLYALQKLSRSISTTLEEPQIFSRIEPSYLQDLGFEKAACFLWNDKIQNFSLYLCVGYSEEDNKKIKVFIDIVKTLFLELIKKEKSLSTLSETHDRDIQERINQAFGVHSFVISPILPKEGGKGFLFAGTENPDFTISEGDEELVTILTNQIGQALENARLFEETWRAKQDSEKKVEERTHDLILALNEVKVISKRKTDFISAVSHELRTPLTSIKGYASILLTGKLGELPEEARLRLERLNRHTDELTHIVNELLDIARIESGRMTMKQGPMDLKHIVSEVSDLLGIQFKNKNIEFSASIPEDASTIFVDANQISRVFINIIGNAIKFTPQNGKISIRSKKINQEVQIDIVDTGCGIPPEARESIFEEFYRVENSINEQVRGTGLGLALVKHIIAAHKGKIWVESQIGQGSTFSFTLPTSI